MKIDQKHLHEKIEAARAYMGDGGRPGSDDAVRDSALCAIAYLLVDIRDALEELARTVRNTQ